MEENQKVQAVQEVLDDLKEKLLDLLYNGEYKIKRINRSFTDSHVNWAEIEFGKHSILLNEPPGMEKNGYVELRMDIKEIPINKALLEEYDKLSIDRELSYYQKKVEELLARKKELVGDKEEQNNETGK